MHSSMVLIEYVGTKNMKPEKQHFPYKQFVFYNVPVHMWDYIMRLGIP